MWSSSEWGLDEATSIQDIFPSSYTAVIFPSTLQSLSLQSIALRFLNKKQKEWQHGRSTFFRDNGPWYALIVGMWNVTATGLPAYAPEENPLHPRRSFATKVLKFLQIVEPPLKICICVTIYWDMIGLGITKGNLWLKLCKVKLTRHVCRWPYLEDLKECRQMQRMKNWTLDDSWCQSKIWDIWEENCKTHKVFL